MAENSIQVVEQKTVLFYGDELVAIKSADGQIYVSVRNLCNSVGIKRPQRQTDRIKRDEVLLEGLQRVPIMGTRGKQNTYVLRADLVPLWLAGIEVSRIGEDLQAKVVQYKKEVAKVLWEAFQDGRLTLDSSFSELLKDDNNPTVQAYKMGQAIMRMAQQQLIAEARLDNHEQRIQELESILDDTKHRITQEQASQISQAVKAVAIELGKNAGGSHFGSVYGELYRRYSISSYKMLPKDKFNEAMGFINNWYQELTDGEDIEF